jgi:MFS transporter, DHA1 family, multidrug resistance protein
MSIVFLRILLLSVFMNAGLGIIIPILPVLLKQYGFTTAGLSLPFVALILGRILSKYYAGRLIRHFDDKQLLMACFILYAFVFLIYPYIHSAWMFTSIRFFEGLVEGTAVISLTDLAIVNSAGENRGKLMGYFGSSFGLGFILGPLLGGVLYQYYGVTVMFSGGALLGALGLFIAGFLDKKNNELHHTIKNVTVKASWRSYLNYLPMYLPSLLRRALFFSFMILIPLYITEHLGLKASSASLFFSGSAILTTTFMPFTGKLADNRSSTKITFISLSLMGLLIVAFGFTQDWLVFTILFIAETIAFAFMLPAGMKVFADSVTDNPNRQEIIGCFGSLTEVVTLILAFIIPSLYALNAMYAWGLLGIACLISAPAFIKTTVVRNEKSITPVN